MRRIPAGIVLSNVVSNVVTRILREFNVTGRYAISANTHAHEVLEGRAKKRMSIEQVETVDFVSIDEKSGEALLTISDHLAWDENEGTHLELFQDKLNAYVRFIESGELLRKFPQVEGKFVVIDLVSKFDLSDRAELLIRRASEAIRNAGFRLQHRVHG